MLAAEFGTTEEGGVTRGRVGGPLGAGPRAAAWPEVLPPPRHPDPAACTLLTRHAPSAGSGRMRSLRQRCGDESPRGTSTTGRSRSGGGTCIAAVRRCSAQAGGLCGGYERLAKPQSSVGASGCLNSMLPRVWLCREAAIQQKLEQADARIAEYRVRRCCWAAWVHMP